MKQKRMKYIVYWRIWLSDLELFNLEVKHEAKGYVRLPDRGEFVVFRKK